MSTQSKFYVTTPIYYATAAPHLGTLYSTILADVAARWAALRGKQVFFLTGTDEFGQKIAQAAQAAGKQPKEFVDTFIPAYKNLWEKYHIEYSKFIRTTDSYHVAGVTQWIKNLQEQGDIYKGAYEGWYCVPCETYLTDKDFEAGTTTPPCLSCQRVTQWVSEHCYFFRLSKYQDQLLQFYKNNPNFITPKERLAEVIAFVESGLQDISISRSTLTWGVPFPGDSAHVTYVWADALNNYITGIGYGQLDKADEFKFWWPADLQVMGKDIVRFHAIYWPAFLMASKLLLPHKLLVHGWIKVGDHKMSKSRGNSIDPNHLLETYGADAVRYYLMKQMAITQDGQFAIDDLEQKIVSDLANDVGNLLQRIGVLAHKQNLVNLTAPMQDLLQDAERDLQQKLRETIVRMNEEMERGYFHVALGHLWKFVNNVNAYFHAQEPWKLAGRDAHRFATVMYVTTYSLHAVALLASPVMPEKMKILLEKIGVIFQKNYDYVTFLQATEWSTPFVLATPSQEPLFKKPEPRPEEVNNNTSVSMSASKVADTLSDTSMIGIEDVVKVDIRVGTIIACEAVQGSDKLLRSQVDFGSEIGMRQVFSGIRPSVTPEILIGSQAVFIVNLKPRKMMGQESQGMMLIVKDKDGAIIPVRPISRVENGARLH